MKQFAAAAILAGLPLLAHAQPVIGPYVSLGAGVNLQQNEILQADPVIGILADHHQTFHPGFAGQASVGYGIAFGLRAEVEGDFLDNVVRGYGPSAAVQRRAGGVEQKYGGFLNVLYDFDLGLPVLPYVGVGAGGQELAHDHFNQSAVGVVFPRGLGSQTVGVFSYQGIAGFALPLPFVQGLSFTTEYRFVGLLDPLPAFAGVLYSSAFPEGRRESRHSSNDFNHTVMLGVRYALFQPSAPPPPAPAPLAASVPAPQEARSYLVFFDWDRADLSQRARQIVAEAAQASQHVHTTRIEVNGYTDLSGTASYNQRLSVRRAETVEAELVRDGVSAGEIAIHGRGESSPLVQTKQGVREPQNRRVEIILD